LVANTGHRGGVQGGDTDTDMYFVLAGGVEVIKSAAGNPEAGADAT